MVVLQFPGGLELLVVLFTILMPLTVLVVVAAVLYATATRSGDRTESAPADDPEAEE